MAEEGEVSEISEISEVSEVSEVSEPGAEVPSDATSETTEPGLTLERRPSLGGGKRRPPPPPPRSTTLAAPPSSSEAPTTPRTLTSSSSFSVDKKTLEAVETTNYYLKQAIQAKDIPALKDLLLKAHQLKMSGDLVAQAQTLVLDKTSEQRVEEIETLRFYLKQGIDLKSRDALQVSLEKVDKLSHQSGGAGRRLNSDFYDLVSKARKELTRLNQEEARTIGVYLKQGIEMKNRELLLSTIEKADKIHVSNPEMLDQDLIGRAKKILTELDAVHFLRRVLAQAIEAKDLPALQSALSKADALKMHAKDFDEVAKGDKLLQELKKKEAKKKKKVDKEFKKKVDGRKSKGGGFVLFGGDLSEAVRHAEGKDVPLVCYETIEFIRQNGLKEPGIFRVSGNQDLMQDIQQKYSLEEEVKLIDVHDAAGVLKQYLRKLPEPLIPFSHYAEFIRVGGIPPHDHTRNELLREKILALPKENRALLTYLMRFLKDLVSNVEVTKMTAENLAIVFAPNLIRPKNETPSALIIDTPISIGLVTSFVMCFDAIFGDLGTSSSSSGSGGSGSGSASTLSAPPSPAPHASSPVSSPSASSFPPSPSASPSTHSGLE